MYKTSSGWGWLTLPKQICPQQRCSTVPVHLGSGTSFCVRFVGLCLLVLIFYFVLYFGGKAEGTHAAISSCLGLAYSCLLLWILDSLGWDSSCSLSCIITSL